MIKFLSNWIEGIVIAVIIASIFEMLLPKGNIKKYVKIVLGIYIVFNIISPFFNNKFKYNNITDVVQGYSENTKSYAEQKNKLDTNIDKIYINTLEKDIKKTIESEGFNVYKCSVKATFDTDKKDVGIFKIEIILYQNKIQKNEQKNTIKIEEVNEIKSVDINICDSKVLDNNMIVKKDIDTLRKFLSEHYEIDKDIIDIRVR